jgi:hypothetical protein
MALYCHPDVIVRSVADDVPTTATFLVTPDDRPPSEALSHFMARARQIGRMTRLR